MPFVDGKYRTAPGRKNRAMAGLSAGGAATYNIGLKHLEIFSQFGLFSAAGGQDIATKYPQLAADAKKTNSQIEVFYTHTHALTHTPGGGGGGGGGGRAAGGAGRPPAAPPPPPPQLGQQDNLSKNAKDLDAGLTKLQIRHTYLDRDGGHMQPVWRWCLDQFAPLLFNKESSERENPPRRVRISTQ